MNDTTKDIFVREMSAILLRIESLPNDDILLKEISEITDLGNLRTVFLNMKFFLENGEVPKTGIGYSSLPAIIFGLPRFQNFLVTELGSRISEKEFQEVSALYFSEYKKHSL